MRRDAMKSMYESAMGEWINTNYVMGMDHMEFFHFSWQILCIKRVPCSPVLHLFTAILVLLTTQWALHSKPYWSICVHSYKETYTLISGQSWPWSPDLYCMAHNQNGPHFPRIQCQNLWSLKHAIYLLVLHNKGMVMVLTLGTKDPASIGNSSITAISAPSIGIHAVWAG